MMASSDEAPGPMPSSGGEATPGKAMTMGQRAIDKSAQMVQSLKPVRQMSQHVCTFAMYSHDMSRQIETHHFVTRVNQDFLQCAVYDSDEPTARLIGVEYILSDRLFQALPPDEQKLWHSHAYEIKEGLWMNPRIPEMVAKQELEPLVKSYGKFWCTWQVDRGDKLPLGAPALMMSPQGINLGMVKPELIRKRDDKYNISTASLKEARANLEEPPLMSPQADYWKLHGKGFAIDVEPTEMKVRAPFP